MSCMRLRSTARRWVRSVLGRSDLDYAIAPEVHNDGFAELIAEIASRSDVRVAIDVGASSGGGTTEALFEGLRNHDSRALVALEISAPRYENLRDRYGNFPWVFALHESSVGLDSFPDAEEVSSFIRMNGGVSLYGTTESEVLRWLEQDRSYIGRLRLPCNGIVHGLELVGTD